MIWCTWRGPSRLVKESAFISLSTFALLEEDARSLLALVLPVFIKRSIPIAPGFLLVATLALVLRPLAVVLITLIVVVTIVPSFVARPALIVIVLLVRRLTHTCTCEICLDLCSYIVF